MNLPRKISRGDDILVNYVYLADGSKYSALKGDGTGFVYEGSFIYSEDVDGNLKLESIPFNGGRFISNSSGELLPRYFITDHLGSVRGILNENFDIEEQNDYYQFGKHIDDPNSQLSDNRYHYNGKENQEFFDLPYLDYGARLYDPHICRWLAPDPLVEKYPNISPYVFCANNPVNLIDPNGLIPLASVVAHNAISSRFSVREHPTLGYVRGHFGVDLSTDGIGHNVHALADGQVVVVGWNEKINNDGKIDGYGRYIVIRHDDGYESLYAHLLEDGADVKVGDYVKNGDVIGLSGNTGASSGPHLHVEISTGNIFEKKNKIDPESIYDLQHIIYKEFNGGPIDPIVINGEYNGATIIFDNIKTRIEEDELQLQLNR